MIYEYECQSKKCGAVFEEIQKLSEPPLTKCKICKKGKVIKLISLPAKPVVHGDFRDEYVKIKKDAKEYAKRIIKGDQNAIADIYGEAVASGKSRKESAKPKTLDSLGGKGKIKRK
jgi:putative FmdB family regulatory protein